jgi:hypothetical protein
MIKKLILVIAFILSYSNLFCQYQATLGDFEFKTTVFGKTTGIFVEGEQSIKVHLKGKAEVIFMFDEERDLLGHGIDNNLTFYDIKEVFKHNNYYHIKTTYLKESEAIFYFNISKGCREIVIRYGDKQLLVLLDSDVYSSENYTTFVPVFEYLDKKY